MTKLNAKQTAALTKIVAAGAAGASAYGCGCTLNTVEALGRRGLIKQIGFGHIWFPAFGRWVATAAGREAVKSANAAA